MSSVKQDFFEKRLVIYRSQMNDLRKQQQNIEIEISLLKKEFSKICEHKDVTGVDGHHMHMCKFVLARCGDCGKIIRVQAVNNGRNDMVQIF